MVDGWKQKYKIDMFTSSQNQVNVLKAMKIRKILGITRSGRSQQKLREIFRGFGNQRGRHGRHDGVIPKHLRVPSETIYASSSRSLPSIKARCHLRAGIGLKVLDIVARLEQDLGVPVVQPVAPALGDERRLHIRQRSSYSSCWRRCRPKNLACRPSHARLAVVVVFENVLGADVLTQISSARL